eukprot:TRINITY_DN8290_c0_g1_i1.p1 TRINITY_DN8290_c0_g1~~TRINITY_DN8290_c0_g1_i1.p1  ORF type:complete len:467 (-),score=121.10 TRINITY_DN8290_c0_g1_i1:52-1452(-)
MNLQNNFEFFNDMENEKIDVSNYKWKDPKITQYSEEWLGRSWVGEIDGKKIEHFSQEVLPGAITTEILSKEWCQKLSEEVKTWNQRLPAAYKQMKTIRGFQLDTFPEINQFFNELTKNKLSKLNDVPDMELVFKGANLMIHDTNRNDVGHMLHSDGSSVTMNICLGDKFEGGDLLISTENCVVDKNKKYECNLAFPELYAENKELEMMRALEIINVEDNTMGSKLEIVNEKLKRIYKRNYFRYKQVPYKAIIHRGEQPHLSVRTTSGTRINLVLFFDTVFSFPSYEKLPKGVKTHLLSFLDEKTISSFRLASKESKSYAESESLWKIKYLRQYGEKKEVPSLTKPEIPKSSGNQMNLPIFYQPQQTYFLPPPQAIIDTNFPHIKSSNQYYLMEGNGTVQVDKQKDFKFNPESYRSKFILERMNEIKKVVFPPSIPMKAMGMFERAKVVKYTLEVEPDGPINSCSIF